MIAGEIITIGDELLQGRTVNGNAAVIGRALQECGIHVKWAVIVADELDAIIEAIHAARARADVLVLTGGLGPTPDDLTRDAICAAFDLKLLEDEEQKSHVTRLFEQLGRGVPPTSFNQWLIPEGAAKIPNPGGTAAGIYLRPGEKHLFALPGVPQEMAQMLHESVVPTVREVYPDLSVKSKTLRLGGIGESQLLEQLGVRDSLESVVAVAYLPNHGLLDVRLTARADDPQEADFQLAQAESLLREAAGEHVYAVGTTRIEEIIGDILLNRTEKLVTAESCTGGLISHRLTDIPGASRWFERGFVTYSNTAKIENLGVSADLLAKHGAVSEEVAKAMAEGALAKAKADWALATTGIAGPEGGSAKKPVGTVWVAIVGKFHTQARKLSLGGADRERIKLRSCHLALFDFYRALVAQTG